MTSMLNRIEVAGGEQRDEYTPVRENEAAFRAILKDIKQRAPGLVPDSLDPDSDLEALIRTYFSSPFGRMGFGIGEFEVGPQEAKMGNPDVYRLHSAELKENEAVIEVHSFGFLSGGNLYLLYEIMPGGEIEFRGETDGVQIRS